MKVTRLLTNPAAAGTTGTTSTGSTTFSNVLERTHEPAATTAAKSPSGASIVQRAIARAAQASAPAQQDPTEQIKPIIARLAQGSKVSGAAQIEAADYEDDEGEGGGIE